MSGIAIVSMLHGYFRQRRTIGCFSSTAGILVLILLTRGTTLITRSCGSISTFYHIHAYFCDFSTTVNLMDK